MRNQPKPGDRIIQTFYDGQPMRWLPDDEPRWFRAVRHGRSHVAIEHSSFGGIGALCDQAFRRIDPELEGNGDNCKACTRALTFRITLGEIVPTPPTRLDRLQAQIERLQAEADRIASLPAEPDVESPTIWFEKTFGRQDGHAPRYTYAAVKAGDGKWYTTGPKTPKGYTWAELIEWITGDGDADIEIWLVGSWEPLL